MSTLTQENEPQMGEFTGEQPGILRPGSGGVWDYISASRLNLWLKCPLAFKFRYIDGNRTPTTASLFVGKRVHDALELYYRQLQLSIVPVADDIIQHVTESWDQAAAEEDMQFASTNEDDTAKKQTAILVQTYLTQVEGESVKPLAVETSMDYQLVDPATGEDLGIPLLGVVDLVYGTEPGPVICDFKTAARSSAPVHVMHEIQLSCYAYLFRQTSGGTEAGLEIRSLIKTKTPKIEFHAFEARSAAHFRRLFAVVRAYLDDLDRGRFVFRPGFGCTMCDFRESHCGLWNGN